ncbi:hypothetical protein J2X47_001970 [Sphingomonas sp. BE270]|jgi:hypothetical protein|uniref:hypothetical protein n=1 Tax=Sphingomonas sp. BE270 TaxID=2817726 RepID=UPI00285A63D5|nr:hypothetical protein [Sphingomonas sp. BE270]MDR7257790.1 hypothetical protein [Sphingomonas sp. BE270]
MLRVIQAFGGHSAGDSITDSDAVKAILDSDQASFVVAVADPEPEADPEPKPAKAAPAAPTAPSSAS